jgi:hypothetical protein
MASPDNYCPHSNSVISYFTDFGISIGFRFKYVCPGVPRVPVLDNCRQQRAQCIISQQWVIDKMPLSWILVQ